MKELARKRLSQNFKKQVRFLSLVFNDFFILAIIFLFGAMMFWYAKMLKQIPNNLWFYRLLAGAIIFLPYLFGRLATLLENADEQFLFTQDQALVKYLMPLLRYSMILPTVLLILTSVILFPFVLVKTPVTLSTYISLLILLLCAKYIQLLLKMNGLYFNHRRHLIGYNLLVFVMIEFTLYSNASYFALLLILILLPIWYYNSITNNDLFDWNYAISYENTRKNLIYSIYSLFTDVPDKGIVIKRRKYLDILLPKNLINEDANSFLYRRTLLRNPEYLNLIVRMMVFGILIAIVVQNQVWVTIMSCLIMYLLIYQLLPVVNAYKRNVMYHVQPINTTSKYLALIKVIRYVIFIEVIVLGLSWLIIFKNKILVFANIAIFIVFSLILMFAYLPNKIKKMGKRK